MWTDVNARSEPILAIVILAGMAGVLLTPAWGTLLYEESLDWLVLAVVTFIGGFGYLVATMRSGPPDDWSGDDGARL